MVEYGFLFNDISTWLAYGGLLLFIICFLYGCVVGEEGGVEPVNFSNKVKSLSQLVMKNTLLLTALLTQKKNCVEKKKSYKG